MIGYEANIPITINNQKVVLLIDKFSPQDTARIVVASLGKGLDFTVDKKNLSIVRKRYPSAKAYGFWRLLQHINKIDLTKDSGFYTLEFNGSIYYLYYNLQNALFISGIILNNNFLEINKFNLDINKATKIEVSLNEIELVDEILFDSEKRHNYLNRIKKLVLQHSSIFATILLSTFIIQYLLNSDAQIAQKQQELATINQQKMLAQLDLKDLESTIKPENIEQFKLMPILKPLSELSLLKLEKFKLETNLSAKRFKINITIKNDKMPLWVSMLSKDFNLKKQQEQLIVSWEYVQ